MIDLILSRSTPGANGCREWTRGKDSNGYGVLTIKRRHTRAHVEMYVATHGPIPAGMEVRHTCDNPSCVEINHLLLGTHADNMRDMRERGRHRWGERPKGTSVNTNRLTEQDVRAIRVDPRSSRTIGKAYGVSKKTVLDVKSGKSWSWL